MKVAIFLVCLVAVALAQTHDETDREDPNERPESTCNTDPMRTCVEGRVCTTIYRNMTAYNVCIREPIVDESCRTERAVEREDDDGSGDDNDRDSDDSRDDDERDDNDRSEHEREDRSDPIRERGDGVSERDTADTINGLRQISCSGDLRCVNNTCRPALTNTRCTMERTGDRLVRCDEEGRYEPLQCRRLSNETNMDRPPSALICRCVRRNGTTVDGTRRLVRERDDLPSCNSERCTFMQNSRRTTVRNGEPAIMSMGGMCARCICDNGIFSSSSCQPRSVTACSSGQRDCMKNGVAIEHGTSKMTERCNMCGCRNGNVTCTRLPACRPDSTDQERDPDRKREDEECDKCKDMPISPVCALREGRTFPTMCHAMKCQQISADRLQRGACRDRNACEQDSACPTTCFRISDRTQMSRQDDRPDARRICVNRTALRCATTSTRSDGTRRIIDDDDDDDPVEDLESDDEDDNVVCGSDDNTYASTCHMLVESRRQVPRVRHPGSCRAIDTSRMVCGTDRVTYRDEETMRTQGGNVRMDYMGECQRMDKDEDDTIEKTCRKVMDNKRCPEMTKCSRMVNTSDGCCPVCGSLVMMAMDQNQVEQHVRGTNDIRDLDTFMFGLMHGVIPENSTKRCDVSATRPTNVPGNVTEILFKARNMSKDAEHCHKQAMETVDKLRKATSTTTDVITVEESFIAAAIVAPELSTTDGAIRFAASPFLLVLGAFVMLLLR